MKFLKRIRARLNSFLSPQPGKTGSSMAFVMIIGAVLVIWVLAIMPLMVAVGNNSLLTQGSYADYLQSRSAIEFCKGELEKIVETKPPYTFCVVKNDNGTYSPIPKLESNSLADAYKAVIDYDQNDDAKDKPLTDANNVVAICAVSQDNNTENVYHITITTYNNGKKNLTYTADYTLRGSLLINPESYKQTQALPLSDFVVVDGRLGSRDIWHSNIRDLASANFSDVTDLSKIYESLLPLADSAVADSGEYPAVFKTPVYPAGGGIEVPGETRPTEPEITVDNNVGLIRPNAVAFDKESKALGDIYYKHAPEIINGQYTDIIKIYAIDSNGNEVDITEQCVIYLNGKEFDKDDTNAIKPEGIYQVSIDFAGTDSILAVNGLVMPELIGQPNAVHPQSAPTGITLSVSGNTVTLTEMDKVVYGYIYADEPTTVHWDTSGSNVLTIDSSKTCFFYAYYPYRIEGDVVYTASPATYIGTVYPLVLATELTNGEEYVIYSSGHALKNENGAPGAFDFTNLDDYRAGSVPSNLKWTAVASNNAYQFMNGSSYLAMPYSNSSGFSLKIESNGNNGKFTISKDSTDNTAFYVSITKDGGCDKDEIGYLTYTNNKFTVSNTKSIIYFYKIPKQVTHPNASDIVTENITPVDKTVSYPKDTEHVSFSNLYSGYSVLSANGEQVNINATPDAGIYEMTTEVGGKTYYLGVLTVKKASLDNKPAITESHNKHNVTVTITNRNYGKDVVRWIGYKPTDSSDYKWFPAYDENGDDIESRKFTLPYGDYEFVVYETGSKNYNPVMSDPVPVSLTEPAEEAPGDGEEGGSGVVDPNTYQDSVMKGSSLYFMGRDNTTLSNGTPDNFSIDTCDVNIYLTTDLLVLRHGIKGDGEVKINPYSSGDNTPGDTLLFAVNDLYNANGVKVFEKLHFYKIPANTDINHMTAAEALALNPKDLNDSDSNTIAEATDDGIDESMDIKFWFRKHIYPEINLDVAYVDRNASGNKYYTNRNDAKYRQPNNNQLSHIIAGETIGWTTNGVWAAVADRNNENDSTNSTYVVCVFVSDITTTVNPSTNAIVPIDCKANRILIAAKDSEGDSIMSVPTIMNLSCRYFSVRARQIVQETSDGQLWLKDLGRDNDFITLVLSWLTLNNYSSKTLQADFETLTEFYTKDASSEYTLLYSIKPQICRFEEDVNLLAGQNAKSLMANYTTREVESLFNFIYAKSAMVNRYTTITCNDDSGKLQVGSIFSSKLYIYSNYIYIDKSVDTIEFGSWLGGTDIFINSQERGYKSEYLGYFTDYSTESYSGTIIYIAKDDALPEGSVDGLDVILGGTPYHLNPGFYYIYATDSGTSIKELVTNLASVHGPNSELKPYIVDPEDLDNYSVYLNDDGTLSNAYVDTGIFSNTAEGAGGFSGGNVG